MDCVEFNRAALPAACVVVVAATLVAPLGRLWRRAGVSGVTALRRKDAAERGVVFGFVVLLCTAFAWVGGYSLYGPNAIGVWRTPAWLCWAGWAAAAAGTALVVAAQAQMGLAWRIGIDERPTALVTHGLFALVRNPIFSGMLLLAAGAVLIAPGWPMVTMWPAAAWIIRFQVRREEWHLIALHGAAYRKYASRVGRFVPGVGRMRAE